MPYHAPKPPTQGLPVSQPWLLVHPWPPVALYSCCKATRWAEGTPGGALPEGLGDSLGEGEGEGLGEPDREELVDTEAPCDEEGEGEGE
jgi:hypothetical protein